MNFDLLHYWRSDSHMMHFYVPGKHEIIIHGLLADMRW